MKLKLILLIDDNDVDNYINKHILSQRNIADTIITMTSAEDALEHLDSIKTKPDEFPDLIFLDIQMPAMNGFVFLEHYHNLPEELRKKCTVIMLTSSEDLGDVEKAKQNAYVEKYLNKPLSEEMISDIIAHKKMIITDILPEPPEVL
jgi:CheY-like chemotaxis protein